MRTVTKTINLYRYNELNDKAKARVKNNYLEFLQECNIFYDDIISTLKEDFPNSKLDIQYSFSYSQGDGANVYGTFNLRDILPYMKNLTEKERKTMEFYADKIHFEITFSHNRRCSYSLKDKDKNNGDLIQDIIDDADNACLRDFNVSLVRRVALFACDYFKQRDKEYERERYEYFFEVDEETLLEWAAANEYEFTEDGEIY